MLESKKFFAEEALTSPEFMNELHESLNKRRYSLGKYNFLWTLWRKKIYCQATKNQKRLAPLNLNRA